MWNAMNVVREIERINRAEIAKGGGGAGSWHDQYKDSAYVFVGGLPSELTEGDVITIFSQFGEPVDINLPRDKQTGKARGFGFIMYENQKSTVLAVDNFNGAKVLGRTLRVDHVSNYKHLEMGEDGKYKEAEMERMNARPELFIGKDDGESSSNEKDEQDLYDGIDPDDPMAAYIIAQRKEAKALAIEGGSSRRKHRRRGDESEGKAESKAERKARREEKRAKKRQRERLGASPRRSEQARRPHNRTPSSSSDNDGHARESRRRPSASPREPRDRQGSYDYGRR